MCGYYILTLINISSEPCHQFQVYQSRREAVRHGEHGVGEILYQQVGYGIVPVYQIKHLQAGPDILKIAERVMAAAVAFFTVQQQQAKPNVYANVWLYDERVPVLYAAGNVVRHIAAVQKVQVNLEIFVGGEVILQKTCRT